MNTATKCSSCNGAGAAEFCQGEGNLIKPQEHGQIIVYEEVRCGVCFGTGRGPSCAPDAALMVAHPITGR
jgi:hypothetical protein